MILIIFRFKKSQNQALVPIIEKIRREEENIRKRKEINPNLFESTQIINRDPVDPIQLESDRKEIQLKRVAMLKKLRENNTPLPLLKPKSKIERIRDDEFDFYEGNKNNGSFKTETAKQELLIEPEFQVNFVRDFFLILQHLRCCTFSQHENTAELALFRW